MATVQIDPWVTIRIRKSTHGKLNGLGGRGETFDEIIGKLLLKKEATKNG
jgi:hypothetical protein